MFPYAFSHLQWLCIEVAEIISPFPQFVPLRDEVRLSTGIGWLYILEMEGSLLKLNHMLRSFFCLAFLKLKNFGQLSTNT